MGNYLDFPYMKIWNIVQLVHVKLWLVKIFLNHNIQFKWRLYKYKFFQHTSTSMLKELAIFHVITYLFNFQPDEKPDVQYSDIGGMDTQKQEIREAVELPLTHVELYRQIGIEPPRGVLMYGPPGCGKTMLAKAVAHHTTGKILFYSLVI